MLQLRYDTGRTLFSASSHFFRVKTILCERHHEVEWGMMIEVSTEELCEINCMTRDCKNQSESDRADL